MDLGPCFFFDLQNWIWRTPVSAKFTHQPRVRQQPIETIIPIPGIRFYSDKNPPAHGTTNQQSETWDKGDTHDVCRGFIFPTDFSGNSSWDILALHVRSEMSLLGMLTIRFRANPQSPKNYSGLYQRTFAKAMTHRCLPTRRYNDWLNGCEVHPFCTSVYSGLAMKRSSAQPLDCLWWRKLNKHKQHVRHLVWRCGTT